MQKRHAPSKRTQFLVLVILVSVTAAILGCRGDKPVAAVKPAEATKPAVAAASPTRSKQQAMDALMALPELKAWASHIEKSSGGKLHGALLEDDPQPRLIDGKRYFQLSFVENGSDAANRWESFLVAETGTDILVEDAATDKTLTLEQWRKEKHPLARVSAP